MAHQRRLLNDTMPPANQPKPLLLPTYLAATTVLLGIVLLVVVVRWAWVILAPFFLATLLAILLLPVQQQLERWRLPRWLAITLAVVLLTAGLLGLLYFIYVELSQLTRELPGLKTRLQQLGSQFQGWLAGYWHISSAQQLAWLEQLSGQASSWVARSVATLSGWALGVGLIPVYIWLLLYYRPLLVAFLVQVLGHRQPSGQIAGILTDTKFLMARYVQGLALEAVLVALLDTVGLLVIGVEHALLLGVLGALLNFIPYIGSIIATIAPMLIALATTDSLAYPATVLAL